MSETIASKWGKGPTVEIEQRSSNAGADWATSPAFQQAIAFFIGSSGARVYHIWGTGAPSTTYDNAGVCSEYNNMTCGAKYRRILNDAGTAAWAVLMLMVSAAVSDTTDYTAFPVGGIMINDTAENKMYYKNAAEASDASRYWATS